MTTNQAAAPPPRRLYIFDADGTLRRCIDREQPCPNEHGEWELIPGVREFFAGFDWRNTLMGIASNQSGVSKGYLTDAMARDLLHGMVAEMLPELESLPILAEAVLFCPHPSTGGCGCRKPEPGMLQRIMAVYGFTADETVYVGDMATDHEAAERAGVEFVWAHQFFRWRPAPGFSWAGRVRALGLDHDAHVAVLDNGATLVTVDEGHGRVPPRDRRVQMAILSAARALSS